MVNKKRTGQSNDEVVAEAIASLYEDGEPAFELEPPEWSPAPVERIWYPDLNPTQAKLLDDTSKFILAYGEKGSGKSIGCLHKIVKHCFEEQNALAVIISPSIRTGKEGVLHDFESLVLPSWGAGMGLEFTPSKLDPHTKDRHLFIANKHGGWSKVILISIPYEEAVQPRIKGLSPSLVYVDELTNCPGPAYFTFIALQLGRRRDIVAPQQYIASCNPEGPSHWVYKCFFEDPVSALTGIKDPAYSVYHVPISENMHRIPPEYVASLESLLKSDPIERARLVEGKWIDRPAGESLFAGYFMRARHVIGDERANTGILPVAGHPVMIGYDLGQVYSAIVFMQSIPTKRGPVWMVFDELCKLGERILYKRLAEETLEKMDFWDQITGSKLSYEHVADSSAVNQWRPGGEGSYDSWEFEKATSGKIRMQGCPKGAGSVEARVRLLQGELFQDRLYVSAMCPNMIEMLEHLVSDKKDPTKPKRSKYLHTFDASTYPILRVGLSGVPTTARSLGVEMFRIGG